VIPEQMLRVFDTIKQKGGVSIRKADLNVWDREVKIAHRLFNVTLEELPGHVPLNTEEFRRFADQMKPLLDTDMVLFAEVDGEPVGFLVAIPDFNRVLMHLNGRLFPFGWLKLLWHIRKIDVISFKLFGVLKEYRRRGIEVLLYLEAVRSAAAKGYEWLDGSLTSEFNPNILNLTERLGVERYKQFRLYEKMF
jgi:GNAT superfamily N-acetyltransferase